MPVLVTNIPFSVFYVKNKVAAKIARVYSYFEKGCRKNVHATIPKGNMGYEQYTVPDTVAVESTFVAFL